MALTLVAAIVTLSGRALAQSPSPVNVFDVGVYGADGTGTNCEANVTAIQSAIAAAHAAGGGTVYFPPGNYCVSDELLGYANITLRGAALGVLDYTSSSRITTSSAFGAGKAVIRMANRSVANYGFQIEDLGISVVSSSSDIVGVDFSGVWYGAIRGVGIIGGIGAGPRHVLSTGSIAFLFSDEDGSEAGGGCFGNLIERTSVAGMDTAYKFRSAGGNETLNTLTNFWTADVMTGIWTYSVGSVGLSFRDGYMATGLGVTGKKAFKHTGGSPTIDVVNVQFEFFDQPNDLPVTAALSILGGGDAVFGGNVTAGGFSPSITAADGYNCGSTSACPCLPGTYPPPESLSFWASVPSGTTLSEGENDFVYYTFINATATVPIPDLYFSFHPTHTGGIGQFFQMSAEGSMTAPYGTNFETYTVKIFVPSTVVLSSDFIFFLEANRTSQFPVAGTCLYPPTL